ncbi:TIGR03758 family integrating conjugative element protein [Endothiovibrio diazotrophicus]
MNDAFTATTGFTPQTLYLFIASVAGALAMLWGMWAIAAHYGLWASGRLADTAAVKGGAKALFVILTLAWLLN